MTNGGKRCGMRLSLERPSVEWAYKATLSRIDLPLAMIIAHRGFACRSATTSSGREASNVRQVRVGDVVHHYFVRPGRPASEFGSFRVVAPENHPHPEYFDRQVPGTALYTTRSEELLRLLTDAGWKSQGARNGYGPVGGEFTGWPIVRAGRSPRYQPSMFPNMTTLQQLIA